MTTTQYPSDQSTEAVLVSANEFLAAARAGAVLPPAEDEIRFVDESEDMRDAIAFSEAYAEWEERFPPEHPFWD